MPPVGAGKGGYERSDVEVGTARRNGQVTNETRAATVEFEVFYHVRRGLRRRKRKQEKQRKQEKERGSFHVGRRYFVMVTTAFFGDEIPDTSMIFIA